MKLPLQDTIWGRIGIWLVRLPSWLAAFALFSLMVMTFSDVILRSVINDPIESATELTRIFMAVIVFASLPLVSVRGEQIVVDLFDGFFSKGAARLRDGLVNLLSGGLLFWPAFKVYGLAMRALKYGDVTEYLRIPQVYITMFIAFFTFLTAGVMVARGLYILFVGQPTAHTDHQVT
ncbi:MAG: TRAP transporter small permease [Rhizobiales bacterium]|nr:TRAP transporter small permease [Hyphomicrobiales bacterium]